ncbi:hypothetical protein C3L33_23220, partial [Rhododendron williamsianum]
MAEQNPKSKSIPPHVKAIAGSIGGTVEACCLQPIDVIKTRLQLDRSGSYRATHLTLKYALRMGSNAVLQAAFSDPRTGELSHGARVLAGFGADVIEALVIVTPFEVNGPEPIQRRGEVQRDGSCHCDNIQRGTVEGLVEGTASSTNEDPTRAGRHVDHG